VPFRGFQVFRLVSPVPFALAALNFVHVRYELARSIGRSALVVLAVVFLFTGVRFRCPICRRWGRGAVEAKGLPWMECESCGTIRCGGRLGLGIVREPRSPEDGPDSASRISRP
jgi:hypothetical protein